MSPRGSMRNSIVWKILAPTPIVIAISLFAVGFTVPPLIRDNVSDAARDIALERVQEFRVVRGLYSKNVIDKVIGHPDIETVPMHEGKENAIPPPATFIHDIGDALKREGVTLKFYSPFPFTIRKDRKLDDFGQHAWEQLSEDNEATVIRETTIDGHRALRVAVGDVFMDQVCVDCHNSHHLSPKLDWQLGDLRGIFEVTVDTEKLLGTGDRVNLIVAASFLGSALLIVLVGVWIGRRIAGRLWQMRDAMAAVAEGNLDVEIPDAGAGDEVGALGEALGVFRDNARRRLELESEIKSQNTLLTETNKAFERFLPGPFLKLIGKENALSVGLGDYALRDMTVLFCDIRDFTSLSEEMTPDDNFRFINSYLRRLGPVIRGRNGFIDKYIGDAIMALFDDADDAVAAAVDMLECVKEYNAEERIPFGRAPIRIGIGLNTGSLMLGTIGEEGRMDGTVISDAVNLAARVEGLTKTYGAELVITGNTLDQLKRPGVFAVRPLDKVTVKGKTEAVSIYEVLNGAADAVRAAKLDTLEMFVAAVDALERKDMDAARALFAQCVSKNPKDTAAGLHLVKCGQFRA